VQLVNGDHYFTSTSTINAAALEILQSASLTYPSNSASVQITNLILNRGTTYFGGRNTAQVSTFWRPGLAYTQTATGNTVIDLEVANSDGTGRFDTVTFAGGKEITLQFKLFLLLFRYIPQY
jgi:hypothetical protein